MSLATYAARAHQLVVEADRKLQRTCRHTADLEDVVDLYTKAANLYKMEKKGFEACECYEKAAELCVKLQEPNEAAYHYVTASKCLCVGDDKNEAHAQERVRLLNEAVKYFLESGKFVQAANLEQELGELCEKSQQYSKAITHYQRACDYLEAEGNERRATKCTQHIAECLVLQGQFVEASEAFDKVISSTLKNDNLGHILARSHVIKSVLCLLCAGDVVGAERRFTQYQQELSLSGTKEAEVCEGMLHVMQSNDVNGLEALKQQHTTVFAGTFFAAILSKIKNMLEEDGSLR